jgi:hypothetical protein
VDDRVSIPVKGKGLFSSPLLPFPLWGPPILLFNGYYFFLSVPLLQSRDSSVSIAWATGWKIGVLGFDSRRGLGIFLFTTASRTDLGPPSLLSNGYQGLFPWG